MYVHTYRLHVGTKTDTSTYVSQSVTTHYDNATQHKHYTTVRFSPLSLNLAMCVMSATCSVVTVFFFTGTVTLTVRITRTIT